MSLFDVMRALYANGINCGMASQWRIGFRVWLGDDKNGIRAVDQFSPSEFDEAAAWLADQARKHFPNSDFARGSLGSRRPVRRSLELVWSRRPA